MLYNRSQICPPIPICVVHPVQTTCISPLYCCRSLPAALSFLSCRKISLFFMQECIGSHLFPIWVLWLLSVVFITSASKNLWLTETLLSFLTPLLPSLHLQTAAILILTQLFECNKLSSSKILHGRVFQLMTLDIWGSSLNICSLR